MQEYVSCSIFGYSKAHDTRLSKNVDLGETSLPDPKAELSTEIDGRLEADDFAKISFGEQVAFANSFSNGSSRLNDEDREALKTFNAHLANSNRARGSNDRS